MPIKLNGSTNGSIEIDVPASCGGDHNLTFPAHTGEVACKNSNGSIDLNGATFSSDVTIDQGQLTVQLLDNNGNNDQVVIGSSGTDNDRSRIKILDGGASTARKAVMSMDGRGRLLTYSNIQAGIRRDTDLDSPSGTTYNTSEFASGIYAYQGNINDDTSSVSACWMRTQTSDSDRWMVNIGSSNNNTVDYSQNSAAHTKFWVNGRGYCGIGGSSNYVGRIRTDTNSPANNYADQTGASYNAYAGPGGTSYAAVVYAAAYESPSSTSYAFLARRGSDDFRVRATDGRIYSDYGASVTNMDYAEFFEWNDGNPNNEDRVGHSVVLLGEKIRIATTDDNVEDIIGIVSKEPAVVGDAAEMRWTQKFLKDEFGNTVYHDEEFVAWNDAPDDEQPTSYADVKSSENCASKARFEEQLADGKLPEYVRNQGFHFTDKVATLNPDYDPDHQYVPREQRSEWEAIGLVGKLWLKPDQPVNPRWKLLKTGPTGNQRWLIR
jgi:hypothetical protein